MGAPHARAAKRTRRRAGLAGLASLWLGLLQPACTFPEYTFADGGGGNDVGTGGATGGGSPSGGGDGGGGGTGSSGTGGGSGGGTGSAPSGGTGGTSEPTCDDGMTNGEETAVDCGGDCPGCEVGAGCEASSDCATNYCHSLAKKCEPSLKIECHCVNCAATMQTQSQIVFRVFNQGPEPLDLQAFKLRYYFDQNLDETATCTSAPFVGGCAQVLTNDAAVTPAVAGADRFVEVGFTSGAGQLATMERTGEMTLTFTPTGGGSFDQQDDFSWVSAQDFVLCSDWTAWRISTRDTLVFGTEPN